MYFFLFLWYQLRILLFHFLFCLFGFTLFVNLVEVCQFCLLFQRTNSWFYWYFFYFFNLLVISYLIFMISFLLLTLGFICSFLIFWGGRLGCLYFRFLFSFEEGLHHYELSSKNCFCIIPQILYSWVTIVICLELFFNVFFDFLIDALVFQ